MLLWAGRTEVDAAMTLSEAKKLFATGKYDACAAAAMEAISEGYAGEDWPLLKIDSDMHRGRYAEALDTLEAALKEFRTSVRLRWLGYRVLLFNNRLDRASAVLEEIGDLATRATYRYNDSANRVTLGRYFVHRGADARHVLETFYDPVKQDQPDMADAYLAAGELALNKGDFALAAEEYQAALKRLPGHADVFFGLARAFAPSDDKQANANLQAALKANPNHIPSLLFLTDHHIDAERYAEAEKLLAQILTINPLGPEAWSYRAVLAHLNGDERAEEEARNKALSTWPRNPQVDHLIGRKLSQKYRFVEGADYQRQALLFDNTYMPAQIQLAQDLLRTGHENEGWKRAELVFDTDQYNVVAHNLVRLQLNMAKFRTLENEDFLVRMDAKEAAIYGQRVLALLTRAKRELCEKYNVEIGEPVIVEIFPRQQDFAIRTFGLPGGAGFLGVCFGRVITANSPASQGNAPSNIESVLWHEFCHVVTLQKTRNRMPRWLSEGISVYEEGQAQRAWGQHMDPVYRQMIVGGQLTPVSELSGAFLNPASPLHLQFAYFESSLVVEYLIEKYGLEVLRRILTDLGIGLSINETLQRHTGSLEVLDQEFADYARERAEKLAPDLTWKELESEGPASVADLEDWLEKEPNNFHALLAYATLLAKAERLDDARTVLERFLALYPQYVGSNNAYEQLAGIERKTGNVDGERTALEQLAARKGDAVEVYLRLMELGAAANDWEVVVRNADRMLAVNPLVPAPHRYLGQAAEQLGQTDRAIEAYRAMLEMDPTDPAEVHFRLAKGLHEKGLGKEAQRHVLMALEEAPRFRDAHRLLLSIAGSAATPKQDAVESATGDNGEEK
jgi:tetratricopeptide (TPR) repeat protein